MRRRSVGRAAYVTLARVTLTSPSRSANGSASTPSVGFSVYGTKPVSCLPCPIAAENVIAPFHGSPYQPADTPNS